MSDEQKRAREWLIRGGRKMAARTGMEKVPKKLGKTRNHT